MTSVLVAPVMKSYRRGPTAPVGKKIVEGCFVLLPDTEIDRRLRFLDNWPKACPMSTIAG